ncbi:hypothetical protein GCK32_002190 [Trichostrongylus colubriformis]|uniref:Uncharacterized protein n=1 Tax=Trichostrongylus colubriformis TaxID=6319 RepID=A0AAN8FYL7_TRICO
MSTRRLDLADIIALLSSGNHIVQSQGLANLLAHFKPPFNNAKERISVLSLFFDCFTNYGDEACSAVLIRTLLHFTPCLTSTCFTILQKCKSRSNVLTSQILSLESSKTLPTLKVLVCSGILSHTEDIALLRHLISILNCDDKFISQILEYFVWKHPRHYIAQADLSRDLIKVEDRWRELHADDFKSIHFSQEDVFLIADTLAKYPETVMNPSFPRSHVLLPPLLSLYSCRSELAKSLPELAESEHLKMVKKVTTMCQIITPLNEAHPFNEVSGFMETFHYLEYVSCSSYVVDFINTWLSALDSMDTCERSVTFAAALLPRCDWSMLDKCFKLIQGLIERSPETVNTFLMLYSLLYAKPYFEVNRRAVLNAIRGLFINRFVVTPAVNFLSIVCRQSGEERSIAYGLLSDLVSKFPTAFDVVKPLALPAESDSLDLLECKLGLMAALCVATDRSDELLPSLSALLRKDAAVVTAALTVVLALCKEEILDVSSIRKQLGSRVKQPGFEKTLAGYCDILATAATLSGEDQEILAQECVVELWEITQFHRNSSDTEEARRAAWAALGSFDVTFIKNTVDVSGNYLVDLFKGLCREERKGFTIFLYKLISSEIESLSRSLYTGLHIRKSALTNVIYTLHNAVGKSNQEAPWFWLATLPLFPVIVGEHGEGGRTLQATKLMRRLLREVPAEESDLLNLFAGWRMCVATLLGIHAESGDFMRSRDSIVEECRRSLQTSELAVNNVLIVLAVLTGELRRISFQLTKMEASVTFEISMRPWVISVLEFVFPLVCEDYTPTTQPIVQIAVNKRCVKMALARSAAWLICSAASAEVTNFFQEDMFSRVFGWRIVSELDPEGNVNNMLAGTESDSFCCLPRSELWLLAAALGADEIVTNSLSRSLPCGADLEITIENSLAGNDFTVDEVSELFTKLSNLPIRVFQKYEKRLRKIFDLLSKSAGEQMKRTLLEGFSKLASVSLLTSTVDLPCGYDHLPENSILRAVVAQFSEKSQCVEECLNDLLSALVGHVRSDGRGLPPLDLQLMLPLIDYHKDEQARLNLLALAFEQRDSQILYELTCPQLLNSSATSDFWTTISKYLPILTSVLPTFRAKTVLDDLLKFAVQSADYGDQIFSDIKGCRENQIVFDRLLAHVPTFCCATDVLHKMLSSGVVDHRFYGRVSKNFDFWLECSGLYEGKLSALVDAYVQETAETNSNITLSIFGYCSLSLSLQSRLDKVVDLLSIGKILLSCQKPVKDIEAVMRLFLALVCSIPSDIPLHWLSKEISTLLFARWRYYWKRAMKIPQFCEQFNIIVAFLFPCFLLDELAPPVHSAVKGMLLYILALRPEIIRHHMEDKPEQWEKLIE